MSSTRTIGLVGCGLWGRLVLRDLTALGARVVVADVDPAARMAAEHAGAPVVASHALLPAVDAIVVATPAVTHAAVVSDLLSRHVPILVEKPFTTDVAQAQDLVHRGGSHLFVGHTWRYHPGIEMLGELARSGELGPVMGLRSTRANWTSPRTDVDSVWNLAPHDLTLAIEILGHVPAPRAAIAEVHDGQAVGLTALLGDSPWLVFEVSNRYRDKRREVRVHGQNAVAVMADPDAGTIEITRGDAASPASASGHEMRHVRPGSALARELSALLAFIDGGPPPKTSAQEGLEVVRTIVRLRELAGLTAS